LVLKQAKIHFDQINTKIENLLPHPFSKFKGLMNEKKKTTTTRVI
jgi:hypothetical protein